MQVVQESNMNIIFFNIIPGTVDQYITRLGHLFIRQKDTANHHHACVRVNIVTASLYKQCGSLFKCYYTIDISKCSNKKLKVIVTVCEFILIMKSQVYIKTYVEQLEKQEWLLISFYLLIYNSLLKHISDDRRKQRRCHPLDR